MPKYALFLVGPTASGKSEVAVMLAQKINGEIISCDSMQMYRGMDIGTAKPALREQKAVPHHLIDLFSPRAECSVFKYRKLVLKAIDEIRRKGKIPIVVGGSGLYFKAVVDGLAPQPGREMSIRKKLESLAESKGAAVLHAKLKKVDPKRAVEIHPNDKRRIIRALEIFQSSNRPPGDWKSETKGLSEQGIQPIVFGLLTKREALYQRIEARVDAMFKRGWIDEVKKLKRIGFSRTARAAIGYQEILHYLAGQIALPEAQAAIKKRTRRLAKKQMTWFRRDSRVQWLRAGGKASVSSLVRTIVNSLKKSGVLADAS